MEHPHTAAIDPMEFRRALGRFATGITIITTVDEGVMDQSAVHGMTANAFLSVSLNPPLVLISVDNRTHMHQVLGQTKRYAVNILANSQEPHSRHFGGRPQEGLEIAMVWHYGLPLLEGALVHLACRVVDVHPAGDHTLYIGQVEHLDYRDGEPLLFYTGSYRVLKVHAWDDAPVFMGPL